MVDEKPTIRSISKSHVQDLFKFQENPSNQSQNALHENSPALNQDKLLSQIYKKNKNIICAIHQHESLLRDDREEVLPEEDKTNLDKFLQNSKFLNEKGQPTSISTISNKTEKEKDNSQSVDSRKETSQLSSEKKKEESQLEEQIRQENSKSGERDDKSINISTSSSTSSSKTSSTTSSKSSLSPSASSRTPESKTSSNEGKSKKKSKKLKYRSRSPSRERRDKRDSPERFDPYEPNIRPNSRRRNRDYIPIQDERSPKRSHTSFRIKNMNQPSPCKYFHLNKRCHGGDKCPYSHDPMTKQEMKEFKSKVFANRLPCKYFHCQQFCQRGESCTFSHDPLTEDDKKYLKSVASTMQPFSNVY